MKRKRTLADLVPPGAKFKRDLGLLALWFALFVLLGSFLIFVIRYENARSPRVGHRARRYLLVPTARA